jgi:hypothetical protein
MRLFEYSLLVLAAHSIAGIRFEALADPALFEEDGDLRAEGLDVVERIGKLGGPDERPTEPVVMETVKVETS